MKKTTRFWLLSCSDYNQVVVENGENVKAYEDAPSGTFEGVDIHDGAPAEIAEQIRTALQEHYGLDNLEDYDGLAWDELDATIDQLREEDVELFPICECGTVEWDLSIRPYEEALTLKKEGYYWTLYVGGFECGCGDIADMAEEVQDIGERLDAGEPVDAIVEELTTFR